MYQTDIDDFLNAAQKLRIEGLDLKEEGPDTSENIDRKGVCVFYSKSNPIPR